MPQRRNTAARSRPALGHILAGLDLGHADQVFRAIALANPGGLGTAAHHDVRHPADTSLLEAMREAAAGDRIAYQYASDFDDIFVTGLFALAEAQTRGLTPPLRAVAIYLAFLSSFADTHIFRKFGAVTAAEVRREATEMLSTFSFPARRLFGRASRLRPESQSPRP